MRVRLHLNQRRQASRLDRQLTTGKLVPIQKVGAWPSGSGCSSGLRRGATLDEPAGRVSMSWMCSLLRRSAHRVPPTQTRGSSSPNSSSLTRLC